MSNRMIEIFAGILLSITVVAMVGGGIYLRGKKHYCNDCIKIKTENTQVIIDPNNIGYLLDTKKIDPNKIVKFYRTEAETLREAIYEIISDSVEEETALEDPNIFSFTKFMEAVEKRAIPKLKLLGVVGFKLSNLVLDPNIQVAINNSNRGRRRLKTK